MQHLLRALKHRNYRLYFSGQAISLIGTWMTQIAMSWLVYRLTRSPFLLGLTGFISQLPVPLFAVFAGIWIDRIRLHRLIIITQILSMVQSLVLAVLTLTGMITIWEILILGFFQGMINVFDLPARLAFVAQMVEDKNDLGNAIALNSLIINMARLLGPILAGFSIAWVGEGMCFLIDGLSYIAVIICLVLMHITCIEKPRTSESALKQLKDGARYAFGFAPIRHILFFIALFSFIGMPHTILMPIFAREVFHGGPNTLGYLLGASGMGALVGAVLLASKRTVLGFGRIVVGAGIIFGGGMVLFSITHFLPLSIFLMAVMGFGLILIIASVNTFLQTIVEDDKRGRVMSLYTVAFIGMVPFGNLLAGSLAKLIGAPHTLLINGGICLMGTFLFLRQLPTLRRDVGPIYVKKGILAAGIQEI